ncbi:MAG: MotA/TolQ/ExbB proton channel family protein [Limisphaerales bacterium]|jgi:biopolymer transport protein ExbB/TolQ|nr:MotA/TolQ/ExbB proton channel family protein [Verrucomicrobiota bacterium]
MLDDLLILAASHTEPDLVYIWQQATLETKLVLFALAIMSVFAWSVMTSKTLQMRRARKLNRIFLEEYRSQNKMLDIFDRDVRVEGCPLFNIYREACSVVKVRMQPVQPPDNPTGAAPAPLMTPTPAAVPVSAPVDAATPQPSPMASMAAVSPETAQPLPFEPALVAPIAPVLPAAAPPVTLWQVSLKTIEHIKRNMERSVAEESLKLESGLIMLAIAVSGSPFLGLLGTVWGVMSAFSYVAVAQSADLATMAPGVAGALIATVGGLLVAIPSMFSYNWLVHNLRVFTVEMDNFAQDLISKIETEFSINE